MNYSENHAVNDTVLTIINDGDGAQCGMTYEERKAAADTGIYRFREACRAYSRYRNKNYGSIHLERTEVIEAASILQEYYREHVAEIGA